MIPTFQLCKVGYFASKNDQGIDNWRYLKSFLRERTGHLKTLSDSWHKVGRKHR